MDRGSELETLARYLDAYRDAARWKLEGLDEDQARRSPVPSGTSLLSVLKHLGYVERWWFQAVMAQEKPEFPWSEDDPDADFRLGRDDTVASVTAFYDTECARSREILAAHPDLEETFAFGEHEISGRELCVHMVEEIARHLGHMDILREELDGATGGFPPGAAPWQR